MKHIISCFMAIVLSSPSWAQMDITAVVHPYQTNSLKSRHIDVTIEIAQWAGGHVSIGFPHRYGPVTGVYKHIDGIVIKDGCQHKLAHQFTPPQNENDHAFWRSSDWACPGPMTIQYVVKPQDYTQFGDLNAVWNIIHDDHATIKGAATFPIFLVDGAYVDFNHVGKISLHYEGPHSWPVYCSSIQVDYNTCQFEPSVDMNRAMGGHATPLGAWQSANIQIAGMNFSVLRSNGWAFDFNQFLQMMKTPLRWQIESMGGHTRSNYQLINDVFPRDVVIPPKTHVRGGERLHDSTYSIFQRHWTSDFFVQHALHTVIHEFHHTFGWNTQDQSITWFREGMTDYMTYKSLFQTKTLNRQQQAVALSSLITEYWNNHAPQKISILEASQNRWENPQRPWRQSQLNAMFYRQVVLAALVIDWLIDHDLTMTHFMKSMWQVTQKGQQQIDQAFIMQVAQNSLGPATYKEFASYLSATTPLPILDMLNNKGWNYHIDQPHSLGFEILQQGQQLIVKRFHGGLDRIEIKNLGLKRGDIVTHLDGQKLTHEQQFYKVLNSKKVGDSIKVSVNRRGQTLNQQIKVSTRRQITIY